MKCNSDGLLVKIEKNILEGNFATAAALLRDNWKAIPEEAYKVYWQQIEARLWAKEVEQAQAAKQLSRVERAQVELLKACEIIGRHL
jgi:hypothetical protein